VSLGLRSVPIDLLDSFYRLNSLSPLARGFLFPTVCQGGTSSLGAIFFVFTWSFLVAGDKGVKNPYPTKKSNSNALTSMSLLVFHLWSGASERGGVQVRLRPHKYGA